HGCCHRLATRSGRTESIGSGARIIAAVLPGSGEKARNQYSRRAVAAPISVADLQSQAQAAGNEVRLLERDQRLDRPGAARGKGRDARSRKSEDQSALVEVDIGVDLVAGPKHTADVHQIDPGGAADVLAQGVASLKLRLGNRGEIVDTIVADVALL